MHKQRNFEKQKFFKNLLSITFCVYICNVAFRLAINPEFCHSRAQGSCMAESCFDRTCRCPGILPFDLATSIDGRIICINHTWILPYDLTKSMNGRIICITYAWILPFDIMTSIDGRIIHINHARILPYDPMTRMDGRIVKRSGDKAVPANLQ